MSLPKTMKALLYSEPRKHSVVQVPLPVVRDGDVLIKGATTMRVDVDGKLVHAESVEQTCISTRANSLPRYPRSPFDMSEGVADYEVSLDSWT
jgi:hypothetical protein